MTRVGRRGSTRTRSSAALTPVLVVLLLAATQGAAQGGQEKGSYIVVLDADADPSSVADSHGKRYGFEAHFVYEHALRGYAAEMPVEAAQGVAHSPNVVHVVEDQEFRIDADSMPTGVTRIDAPRPGNGGQGVEVAVVDTGIDLDHPELQNSIVGTKNCANGSSADDGNGHGTHVAGTIAAAANGTGVVGVAPGVKLWAVRVLNDFGIGFTSWIICGIDFVAQNSPANGGKILVANMSLGGPGTDDGNCGLSNGDVMHQAICEATNGGTTFVVAAGNEGVDVKRATPAAYDEVLTVTALGDSDGLPCGAGPDTSRGADDTFADFSNFATLESDLAHTVGAPGVDIHSTWRGGGYETISGTSMASPHAAGVAALFIRRYAAAKRALPKPDIVIRGMALLGEPLNADFGGECPSGAFSHSDPSGRHPEPVVRSGRL